MPFVFKKYHFHLVKYRKSLFDAKNTLFFCSGWVEGKSWETGERKTPEAYSAWHTCDVLPTIPSAKLSKSKLLWWSRQQRKQRMHAQIPQGHGPWTIKSICTRQILQGYVCELNLYSKTHHESPPPSWKINYPHTMSFYFCETEALSKDPTLFRSASVLQIVHMHCGISWVQTFDQ